MKIRLLFLTVLTICVSSCNFIIADQKTSQTETIVEHTPSSNSTETAIIQTAIPTSIGLVAQRSLTPSPTTDLVLTLTPFPSIMPTSTLHPLLTQHCLEVRGEIAIKDVSTGTIVVEHYTPRTSYFTFLDIQTGSEHNIPTSSEEALFSAWHTSPNRNMFAYVERLTDESGHQNKSTLWIVNARADVLQKVTFDFILYGLHWLDDDQLTFTFKETIETGTLFLFNPFTLAERYIVNEMPGLYEFGDTTWLVVYSPDLEWGVYVGSIADRGLEPIVRDFIIEKNVWYPEGSVPLEEPNWSPNGKQVAVIGGGNLYLVNRSGQAKSILNESEIPQISKPSWSPDGRYIAFWNYKNLMLFDVHQDQVFDLCMMNPDDVNRSIVWSADSNQFAVLTYPSENKILVDVLKWAAYQLPAMQDAMYPIDWMNSMP